MIRGVNVIDGAGGTARGPMDIVIQGNRITEVRSAGTPGVPLEPNRPPRDADYEVDATGMWVMPGLVDEHVHAEQGGTPLTYAYKLWLAHGVTTVRGVNLTGNAAAVRDKAASEAQHDRRAADRQLPAAGQRVAQRRDHDAREGARVGPLGVGQRHRRRQVRRHRRRPGQARSSRR